MEYDCKTSQEVIDLLMKMLNQTKISVKLDKCLFKYNSVYIPGCNNSVNIFLPEGCLFQVEYAIEATVLRYPFS